MSAHGVFRTSVASGVIAITGGVAAVLVVDVGAARALPVDTPQWGVSRVTDAPDARGPWRDCATLRAGGRDATVTCSRSFAVANTISAGLGVSYKQLTLSLGYSVTQTVTLTGGGSFPVKKHQRRTVQWAPRYTVKNVESSMYLCPWKAVPPNKACRIQRGKHRSGKAKRAAGIEYRLVK
jgi:hypothetical protein